MKRRDFIKTAGAASAFTVIKPSGILQTYTPEVVSSLSDKFLNPPAEAKPGALWFWMNGQVTKEGITADLEAMNRVGLGTVFNFDAGTGIPKGPLEYLSPEWYEVKSHAIKEASRLGMGFSMHNCPGWSSSGGPWITAEKSMKGLTWTETKVKGGSSQKVVLELPKNKLNFYRDIAILAYPSLPEGTPLFPDWQKKTNVEFSRTGSEDISNTNLPAIEIDKIINLSEKATLQFSDVSLDWDVPAGEWTILRIGYTSLEKYNRSSPDTGYGLECDKYDASAITFHFEKMMTSLLPILDPLTKKGKMGLEIDSYEVGMQNWTDGFENIFKDKNGYELLPYLPALTGRVVSTSDFTERFLYDLRRTQADLIADNYYGTFRKLCKANGITSFIEPYDRGPMEEMQIGSRADSVMGEYWNGLSRIFQNNLTMRRTCKLASSIGHINGQKIIGVEGLTAEPISAKWQEYAFAMKPITDKIFLMGVNRILVHRYAHQPHPTAVPGMTMGPWGIHFERTNTLWETNKAWLSYLSRCQAMLQEGVYVADIAYLTSEEPGIYTKVEPHELPSPPPEGYEYDLINAEILEEKGDVKDGMLTLTTGMKYRVLVLPDETYMSLKLLKKLKVLVEKGLVLIGKKPKSMPGLGAMNPVDLKEFNAYAQYLWGVTSVPQGFKTVNSGRVEYVKSVEEVLNELSIAPDFTFKSAKPDAPIRYIHRKTDEEDVYFVCNQRRQKEGVLADFRIADMQPEIWDPATGKMYTPAAYTSTEGRTQVHLELEPYGSVFVVFRKPLNVKKTISKVLYGKKTVLNTKPNSENRKLYMELVNDFSFSLWAKPEYDIMLTPDGLFEGVKHPWTDFYTLYPAPGSSLYGNNHATAGITIGRNGIAIWENENGTPIFNTSVVAAISGWNHVVVVYKNGAPHIYLNGKKLGNGPKQFRNVHPVADQAFLKEGASYYNGDYKDYQVFDHALEDAAIALQFMSQETAKEPEIEAAAIFEDQILLQKKGKFQLINNKGGAKTLKVKKLQKPLILNDSWTVNFQKERGAPASVTLDTLMSLTQHPTEGVKYFSGTAVYQKSFEIEKMADKRYFLDLGEVEVVAEVELNGKSLGILWKRPYKIDLTEELQTGQNNLSVKVTNQWVNRLIGDEQQPAVDEYTSKVTGSPFDALGVGAIVELPEWYKNGEPKPDNGRVTFSTWKHYDKNSPLLNAGLIGPVVIYEALAVTI